LPEPFHAFRQGINIPHIFPESFFYFYITNGDLHFFSLHGGGSQTEVLKPPDNRRFFATSSAKNPQVQQAASSLSRFARKTIKKRLKADFLPCKLRKQPR
jgi:hypothetical protein